MKIQDFPDGRLVVQVENEADVDTLLGFIGEAPVPHDDASYDLRIQLHAAKDHYVALRDQPSLFDEASKPATVTGVAQVPVPNDAPITRERELKFIRDMSPSVLMWAMDQPKEIIDQEWDAGFQAGWRGDELVIEKSPVYLFAYEQGQVDRGAYNERFPPSDGD